MMTFDNLRCQTYTFELRFIRFVFKARAVSLLEKGITNCVNSIGPRFPDVC